METIRWGIIGCGSVAETKGGPALYQAPGSKLTAVMSRNPERARSFAERHGAVRWCTAVEDLLADEGLDAVYIATPPDTHAELTEQAARAKKHVLCEKPMALNVEECRRMIAACRDNGVQLMIAYYRRFYPVVLKMKELVREGRIGDLVYGRVLVGAPYARGMGWRVDPAVAGGGFVSDVGSHRIDLLNYFLGTPLGVSGLAESVLDLPVDDTASAVIRYEKGLHAVGQFYWTLQAPVDEFEIGGTQGRLLVTGLEQGALRVITKSGVEEHILPRHPVTHYGLVEHFVRCLREGKPNDLPGEEGMKTTVVLDALYQASKADGCRTTRL